VNTAYLTLDSSQSHQLVCLIRTFFHVLPPYIKNANIPHRGMSMRFKQGASRPADAPSHSSRRMPYAAQRFCLSHSVFYE
jgi:hypothetical protein